MGTRFTFFGKILAKIKESLARERELREPGSPSSCYQVPVEVDDLPSPGNLVGHPLTGWLG